jgi:hypothetical protein
MLSILNCPQVRSLQSLKFIPDSINLYNLISLKYCGITILGNLISAALARNASKQTQRRFLQFLKKLPHLIRSFNYADGASKRN